MTPYNYADVPQITYIERTRKKKKEKVCSNIICFDIETSSYFYDGRKKVYTYRDIENMYSSVTDPAERYNKINEKMGQLKKGACCYLWQLGIDDKRFYGRSLAEFKSIFVALISHIEAPLIVYVHNLAYEYEWLRGIFGDDNIDAFFTESRKPLYFKYQNAEFRCTYRLTNSSLSAWGKKLGLDKLDTLDYGELYTPLSKLPQGALDYSERDIEIMYHGIKQYAAEYGNIWNIPYTQTGQVRRDIKALYKKNYNYHYRVTDMLPRYSDEYKTERCVFMGGMCFSGIKNAGKLLQHVGSFDRGSAYPFQMVTRSFPASRFRETLVTDFEMDTYHYIFYAELSNVRPKSAIHCIPISRMVNKIGSGEYDNGKLISFIGWFHMFLTEQDLKTYQRYYEFDFYVSKAWVALSRLLDTDLVKYVLKLYGDKTTLKGIPEMAEEYQRKKERLNSIYGCCVSRLVYDTHELVNNEWIDRQPTDDEVDEALQGRYKNMWKNILAYHWGVWITAYQRADLLETIAGVADSDFCYTDTDSIKMINPERYIKYFDTQNDKITARINQIVEHRGMDISLYQPEDKKGNKHLIGLWENEGIYDRAIFLGAKRYCYEQDGSTHVVVSGVPKVASKNFDITTFKDGLVFTPEMCGYKKSILTYIDGDNKPITLKRGQPDAWTVNDPYAINMAPTGYDMSLTKEYSNLIELYNNQDGIPI